MRQALQRVAVVDYGIGNVRSVVNACTRAGVEAGRVGDGEALAAYHPDRIILPGVGAVGAALGRLRERGLEPVLNRLVVDQGLPFLGICVGMQMLAETCEEFGTHQGLGWVPGRVVRLSPNEPSLRVPHVGWNSIIPTDGADPMIAPVAGLDMYFVHSFAFDCADTACVAAWTEYGGRFVSAVRRNNIAGVQFHPEKSGPEGARLLAGFFGSDQC